MGHYGNFPEDSCVEKNILDFTYTREILSNWYWNFYQYFPLLLYSIAKLSSKAGAFHLCLVRLRITKIKCVI